MMKPRQLPPIPSDDCILTFNEWIRINKISPRTGRRVLDGPNGPKVTRMSPRRVGITVLNNRLWQKSREQA